MGKGRIKNAIHKAEDKAHNAVNNVKATVKNTASNIKTAGGNVKNGIKKVAENLAGAGALKVLIPIKPQMLALLRVKGVKMSLTTPTDQVAIAFYNRVVLGKQNFNFESADTASGDPSLGAGAVAMVAKTQGVPVSPEMIQGIFDFIRKLVGKKQAGETLTPEEADMAKTGGEVADAVENKDDTGGGSGSNDNKSFFQTYFMDYWWAWLALLIILAIVAKKKGWI